MHNVTHICWPIHMNEEFGQSYLDATGEQLIGRLNAEGDYYLTGSSRLSQESIDLLQEDFPDDLWPDIFYFKPDWWEEIPLEELV